MKVLIIGAGPIGAYSARLLRKAKSNCDVELIEEHAEIGRPVHCAGLVSTRVLSESKIPIDKRVIINQIDGAEFYFGDDSFKIRKKNSAFVIDREKFDRSLGVGLNIDFNTRFVGIEKNGSRCLVETDRGDRYADIVIGADGANSQVRKVLNLKESVRSLRGVQFRIHHRVQHKNFVQVHIRNPFFAWVIPENKDTVRTGIISDNPYHDLLEFLSERNINGRIIEKFAGVVPLGRCATQKGSVALVGDAGCQIKPLTYGGIYYGMRCAEVLADCIVNNRLSRYEQEWNQRYGRELKIGFRVRQMLDRLNPENMKSIFSLLKKDAKVLESFIDFENHSKIISAIIKNPSLQKLVGKIFINIMKDFPMSLLS